MIPRYTETIEYLAGDYMGAAHSRQVAAARWEYDSRRGRVFDDEGGLFEEHLRAFVEWYLAEHADGGVPPAIQALRSRKLPEAERLACRALAASYRSLFVVRSVQVQTNDKAALLFDFVRGGRWRASCSALPVGPETGDIFEGRVLPWQGGVCLGPTMLFHPRGAAAAIRRLVERRCRGGLLNDQLVCDLARMRTRLARSSHIKAAQIYRDPTPTRVGAGREAQA